MTFQLHDTGKQYSTRVQLNDVTPVSSVQIGLFNDSSDNLAASDDVADINTEPQGASYSRQTVSAPSDVTFALSGTQYNGEYVDLTFDTSDSSQTIDGYFEGINYQTTSEGSASLHLHSTQSIGNTLDLTNVDQLILTGTGIYTDN